MEKPPAENARKENVSLKLFIIRPWHSTDASLYPFIMDSVEYVGQVIDVLRRAGKGLGFDVRVDEDAFITGTSLQENLERELTNADVVFVILDGLRPNVVYELGYVCGKEKDYVLCLQEENATVLVRNYYSSPKAIPTVSGHGNVIVQNPPLSMAAAFSDYANMLSFRFSRLALDKLEEGIKKYLNECKTKLMQEKSEPLQAIDSIEEQTEPKTKVASPSTEQKPDAESSANANVWADYTAQKYETVVELTEKATDANILKARALALMKLGNIFEAIAIWKRLVNEPTTKGSALCHLGICRYIVGDFDGALSSFNKTKEIEEWKDNVNLQQWIDRTQRRLSGREDLVEMKSREAVEKIKTGASPASK